MGTGAAAAGLAGAAATAGAGDLGPAVAAVKANVARSVAVIKQSRTRFSSYVLLVRVSARTPPVRSMPTAHLPVTPAQYKLRVPGILLCIG